MGQKSERANPAMRLFRTLVEARWFFSFTSSVCATIIGISLTFGINSCREAQRARNEMRKSMLQAVDNLGERFEEVEKWMSVLENETRIYEKADSIYTADGELPENVCDEFYNTFPYIRISAFDHEFEKIFRGSYQLWQLQNANDSIAFYIGQCYDGLNMVENTCRELTEGMIEQIGLINSTEHFHRLPPREWTLALITDTRFQYYMSVRWGKTIIASSILRQAKEDYETNVVPRSRNLRYE